MSCDSVKKQDMISKFGSNIKDSGRTEVQIVLLTKRIDYLKLHFDMHKKDYSSRRGLLRIVVHRRRLLKYLKKNSMIRYNDLVVNLGLRH